MCPPVEGLISQCACNKNGSQNVVTISGSDVTVTNLTGEDGYVMMYLVSTSSGCQNECDIKTVEEIYRINVEQDGE